MSTPPDFASGFVNLASPRLGAKAVFATDEFFAPKERLLSDAEPVFMAGKYDEQGKWMDGWESRRRRDGGHDFCVVRLGMKAVIRGVDIDTRHFTGNYPPAAFIDTCLAEDAPADEMAWTTIVPPTALGPNAHHFIPVGADEAFNFLRLHILPDGGVARLRIYGEPVPEWTGGVADGIYELSALRNGGRIVAYNDAHYGTVWTLLCEGRGLDMGDGWETRRRREPGNDWIIVRLGAPGTVERVVIDTAHFKGNFPESASVQAALVDGGLEASVVAQSMFWPELMPRRKLSADSVHDFDGEALRALGPVDHVKLNIHPDGGVSRIRVFGQPA